MHSQKHFHQLFAEFARIGIEPSEVGNRGFALRDAGDLLTLLRSIPDGAGPRVLESRLQAYIAGGPPTGDASSDESLEP